MKTNYNTAQAAENIGLSSRTLERLRYEGKGPKYFKLGSRVLYSEEHLESWLNECETSSTTQSTLKDMEVTNG